MSLNAARDKPAERLRVGELLANANRRLADGGIETPALDARILLAEALSMEPGQVISCGGEIAAGEAVKAFKAMVDRRLAGEPVHRILGRREFFSRMFHLTPECLIPRPETELLVERVLEDVGPDTSARFADIGCGSGAICVSLLAERPGLAAVATDLSEGALAATRENAKRHGVAERLETVRASYLENVEGPFSFIVSNPPYIATGDLAGLSREVREHDPQLALDGGADGLEAYQAILSCAPQHLEADGRLYLETGHGQHDAIMQLAKELRWGIVSSHLDLSGLERMVVLEKR
ncbi:MAG: peptide chain release factor N(5)-glutamine methyltransferase [Nitratireductor sp.]|nr:peptide chain release factor N(5)-glutamine methyltransferase [Nitratireductor sp.]